MKITKILSAVAAAAVATAAVSATAGATLTIPTGINTGLSATTGMWMVALYNSPDETTGNPGIDYGIDLTSIASISVTVTPSDPDWWNHHFLRPCFRYSRRSQLAFQRVLGRSR